MTRNKLSKLIDKQQIKIKDEPRNYIGASIIGSQCLRQIWYEFKGAESESVSTKTRRTWDIGKNLEGLICTWLFNSGISIFGEFKPFKSKNVSEFQGNVDGIIFLNDEKFILEIKTAKNASFNIFVNKGVKIWNPQYYAQIQSYMGMSGIFSTYILVLNKDNSEISDELVTFDEQYYEELEQKAMMISKAVSAPPRINGSPLFYKCKMCKFNNLCHK